VHFAIGDFDKRGNAAARIQQCMQFDRAFAVAKAGPRKQGQAQVDGGRIQRVHRLIQFDAEVVVEIQPPGRMDQHLGKIGVNAPVSVFVGIGQRAAGHVSANAHGVEFAFQRSQTGFAIAQAFSVGELSKSHAQKLIEAGKVLDLAVAAITLNAFLKIVYGEQTHQM